MCFCHDADASAATRCLPGPRSDALNANLSSKSKSSCLTSSSVSLTNGSKFLATWTHTLLSLMGLTSFGFLVQNMDAFLYESTCLPSSLFLSPPDASLTAYLSLNETSFASYALVQPSSVNASLRPPSMEKPTDTSTFSPAEYEGLEGATLISEILLSAAPNARNGLYLQ